MPKSSDRVGEAKFYLNLFEMIRKMMYVSSFLLFVISFFSPKDLEADCYSSVTCCASTASSNGEYWIEEDCDCNFICSCPTC